MEFDPECHGGEGESTTIVVGTPLATNHFLSFSNNTSLETLDNRKIVELGRNASP